MESLIFVPIPGSHDPYHDHPLRESISQGTINHIEKAFKCTQNTRDLKGSRGESMDTYEEGHTKEQMNPTSRQPNQDTQHHNHCMKEELGQRRVEHHQHNTTPRVCKTLVLHTLGRYAGP